MSTMNYQCPICSGAMVVSQGSGLNPQDGVTIWCPHLNCPAQEVSGHGGNEKEAWGVVQAKFVRREARVAE